jgi:ATP-dependent Clp protease ATP-binding subunit ClpA
MFERFTDRARRVVVLAQEEARLLNHNYIGTEHLLLGLIHEGDGIAARALEALDISLKEAQRQVQEIIGRGAAEQPSGHIPFTPRAKKVLELSLREALQLGHNYIGTEHILLGLIREGEGVGAQVLTKLGADLSRVRDQVTTLLAGMGVDAPSRGREAYQEGVLAAATIAWEGAEGAPSDAPRCSRCGADLAELGRYRTIAVREQTGDGRTEVLFVYCGRCGCTFGALPTTSSGAGDESEEGRRNEPDGAEPGEDPTGTEGLDA